MATRRQFTSEFKLEIVKMVIDQGGSIGKLSKDLSINDNLIRRWVKQYQLEQTGGGLKGYNLSKHVQYWKGQSLWRLSNKGFENLSEKINLLDQMSNS